MQPQTETVPRPAARARMSNRAPRLRSELLGAAMASILVGVHSMEVLAANRQVTSNCSSPCKSSLTCHTSFTLAINAAGPGDTIFVCPGTYLSTADVVDKVGRLVIKAVGSVTIDGSNDFSDEQPWTRLGESNVWKAKMPFATGTIANQLFVDDVRYTFISSPGGGFENLAAGQYSYGTGDSLIYANVSNGDNPGDHHNTHVSIRSRGFRVWRTQDVTISGFTVLRTTDKGIDILGNETTGARVDSAKIEYCTSARNWGRGVSLVLTSKSKVLNSVAHTNRKPGIYLLTSDNCDIKYNTSYRNDDPTAAGIAGGTAGIKIGDSTATVFPRDTVNRADVSFVNVDYNVVYENEDTGIDVKSARQVLVRRNQSYRNGDHGYDNNNTSATTFMNNVAARNDHDGMSIESTSENVGLFNNIFWHNALNASTLAPQSEDRLREVFVDNTVGFTTDYNVICGLAPVPIQDGTRYLVEFPNDVLYSSWAAYRAGQPNDDVHSHPFDPAFVDSVAPDLKLSTVFSAAVDSGRADLPAWLSTDPRGFVPHDNDSIPNGESGSPNYAEIGAFEYDIKPSAMDSVIVDVVTSTSIHLKWKASGDDERVGKAPSACLRMSQSPVTEATFGTPVGNTVPGYPATWRDTTYANLFNCTLYYFGLKYGGGNNLWAFLGDTARAVTSPVWYQGHWACEDGLGAGDLLAASGGRKEPEGRAVGGAGETVALTEASGPVSVEVTISEGGLGVKLVVLRPEDAPGYEEGGGGGVVYQEPDGGGGWAMRLKYALPEGRNLALLVPERSGRWMFLEPLLVRGIPSTVVGDGTEWQLQQARHSREGDVTAALTGGDRLPAFNAGDTLTAQYSSVSAEADSRPTGLVVLDTPADGTMPSRAGGLAQEASSNLPAVFALHQNQPNPFSTTTTFRFDLPRPETVRLEVFDVMGRKVATLRDAWMPAGRHSLEWKRRDVNGSPVQPGAYLYRLTAGSFRAQRKVVVLP